MNLTEKQERLRRALNYLFKAKRLPAEELGKIKALLAKLEAGGAIDKKTAEEEGGKIIALIKSLPDYHMAEVVRILTPESFLNSFTLPRLRDFTHYQDKLRYVAERLGKAEAEIDPDKVPALLQEIEIRDLAELLNMPIAEYIKLTDEERAKALEKVSGYTAQEIERIKKEYLKSTDYLSQQIYDSWGVRYGVKDLEDLRATIIRELGKGLKISEHLKTLAIPKNKAQGIKKRILQILENNTELQVAPPPDVLLKDLGSSEIIKVNVNWDKIAEAFKAEIGGEIESPALNKAEPEITLTKNQIEGLKTGKIKRAGHLTDQILKYRYPKDSTSQLSIFDSLQDSTKKEIARAKVEVTEIVEGIKLSPSETKLIDSLCKLLHEKSQTFKPGKKDYYAGNSGSEELIFSGTLDIAPKLAFTLYELTKEYKGGEAISGKDIDNVKAILTELDNRKFLLSYIETVHTKKGGRIERKMEDFRKLIHIVKISQTEFSRENIELSKKEETVIMLNPIFRRQIDSKFILYPPDLTKRTIIAYGSHNISEITFRLRDYLIRELAYKRYGPEIGLDRLYFMVAEKWMREGRKKKVKEYLDKAIETVKALGLLLSYQIKQAGNGEPKAVFYINKDWE